MTLRIGVDLGGTNVRAALISEDGTILRDMEEPTEATMGPEYVIAKIIKLVKKVKGEEKVIGLGVGSPGPLDSTTGTILSPPNLPGWDRIPLAARLEEQLGLPVKVDNDANAAALAEALFGAGKGFESVYYITVSTGVGGGFVINGKVFAGADGYAGEIGNMIILPNGPKSSSMNAGALEALASGTAIGFEGEKAGITGGASEVFRLAEIGDIRATKIIAEALDYLAIGIANLTHAINPDVFVLGGGVMESGDQLLLSLREKVPLYLYPGLQDRINIVPAHFGSKAGVVGAALLV